MRPLHGRGNLWHPEDEEAGEDHGAHGVFDNRSHRRSVQLWATRHVVTAGEAVGAAVTRAVDAVRARTRSGRRPAS